MTGVVGRGSAFEAAVVWEASFAREKASAIESYLAGVPPELREERRRALEAEFAKVEAKERKKHGFPPGG